MPKKKKISPEEVIKEFKQKEREITNVVRRSNLNTEAYNYISEMITHAKKKSAFHLMLLYVEDLLNENGQKIREQFTRKKNEIENFYKTHKLIINQFSEKTI